ADHRQDCFRHKRRKSKGMSLENIGPDYFLDFRPGIGISLEADRQEMRHDLVIGLVGGRGREDAEETCFPASKGCAELFANLSDQPLQSRLARLDLPALQHETIRAALADKQKLTGRVPHQRCCNYNLSCHALAT